MAQQKQYILVDGYNVTHSWPQLKRMMGHDIDAAASLLVERLSVLHDAVSCEVTVVFDGKSDAVETMYPAGDKAPCVIYSPSGTSADAIIEQIVNNAPDGDAFTVVSKDNALCLSVFARGAHVISPETLLERVRKERDLMSKTLLAQRKKHNSDFGNKLFQ
ncbi:MAG: NYN domain-containing protein [Opitutales bacterium]|nr:NYN domain-containing protein [Opitutales bacterium]